MSEHRLKQRYTIGSKEKPTLEECLNCKECEKHFYESTKKTLIFLNKEEINDLKIDCYIYACNKYNGKSNFLTFLFLIARQHASKLVKKRVKEMENFNSFKKNFNEKTIDESMMELIQKTLPEELHSLAIDKYINYYSLEKISKIHNLSISEINKMINRIKKYFME